MRMGSGFSGFCRKVRRVNDPELFALLALLQILGHIRVYFLVQERLVTPLAVVIIADQDHKFLLERWRALHTGFIFVHSGV